MFVCLHLQIRDEATHPLYTRKLEAATGLIPSTFCHPRSNIYVLDQQTWKAKILDVLLSEPKLASKRQRDVPWIGVRSWNLI